MPAGGGGGGGGGAVQSRRKPAPTCGRRSLRRARRDSILDLDRSSAVIATRRPRRSPIAELRCTCGIRPRARPRAPAHLQRLGGGGRDRRAEAAHPERRDRRRLDGALVRGGGADREGGGAVRAAALALPRPLARDVGHAVPRRWRRRRCGTRWSGTRRSRSGCSRSGGAARRRRSTATCSTCRSPSSFPTRRSSGARRSSPSCATRPSPSRSRSRRRRRRRCTRGCGARAGPRRRA